jgi:hypothetical protein
MNADAAIWLAGCIIFLVTIPTIVFILWAYTESVKSQALHKQVVRERRLLGKMQVKEIELYTQVSK